MIEPKPYDAALKADPQRKEDYYHFREMYRLWDEEKGYLERTDVGVHADAEFDELDYLIKMQGVKQAAAVLNYVNQYSPYKLQDDVQVVENNRVQYIGNIREIYVAFSPKDIENAKKPRYITMVGQQTDVIYHAENEFIYLIYSHTHTVKNPTYRVKSPRIILPKPSVMYHKCPLCFVEEKPLVGTVIGGAPKVICVDCNTILNDLFGAEHVKATLRLSSLTDAQREHIIGISEAK
jgi:hypothetical protein